MAQQNPAAQAPTKKRSQAQEVWMRLKKNKQAMAGLFVFIVICIIAISAPLFIDYDTQVVQQNIPNKIKPPSAEHPLGTDALGRDVMARLIYGARISLTIGLITAISALTIGGLIGAVAGFYGGKLDDILMRIMDIFLSLPSMLLAIAVIASLGSGITNIMIAVAVSYIPYYARIIRSSVLSIRNKEYIESARAIGTSDFRIIMKHIIPNAIGPVIVQATLGVGEIIISAAGLSFLGLGIEPPLPEWGKMLSEGKEVIRSSPYLVIFPGLCIMTTVLSLNLLGDGLRDALDPRLK
ncbi:MAG: ABC transporter permease [Firmicutes bacterium]|nr:ABC transporter permease [Bacillota bacterium]MBR6823866.1 ABC transporter permease [Bacillota bacterium]MBR7113578.1 ABC transporter permease [Bacillota bacterium]